MVILRRTQPQSIGMISSKIIETQNHLGILHGIKNAGRSPEQFCGLYRKQVCPHFVGVFPGDFPLVGVEHRSESSNSVRSGQVPTRPYLLEPLAHQVLASTLDQTTTDRPTLCQSLAIIQPLRIVAQILTALAVKIFSQSQFYVMKERSQSLRLSIH